MKVVFLGTNGWYDTETGNTTCILIETKKEFIILDAGNGLYKIDKYIKTKKPIYLFLSHFHFDHIIGLHILNKFNFKQGLHIYGQKGTKRILSQIINRPFTIPLNRLPFKVLVHELPEGVHFIPFYIECRFLLHASKCLGFRFRLQEKIITYCTDTGYCENISKLSRYADLFIAECSYTFGQQSKEWPHLNPEKAAQIAKRSRIKKLALIHFDANIYKTLQERKQAQEKARQIFSNTIAAVDDMEIEL